MTRIRRFMRSSWDLGARLAGVNVRDHRVAIQRVRLVVAAAVAVQFLPTAAIAGQTVPHWRPLAAAVFVGGLLLVSGLTSIERRVSSDRIARRLGVVQLVIDTGLAVGIYWLFLPYPAAPVWALLLVAVVEGAVRYRLVGALAVAAGGVLALLVGELHAATTFAAAEYGIGRVLMRSAILLVVAVACGSLAEHLTRQILRQRAANASAEQRARLLARVAEAARHTSTLDPDTVLDSVVDAAVDLGFEAAEICLYESDEPAWRLVHPRGLDGAREGDLQPLEAGVAGLVYERRCAVVIDDYTGWQRALPEVVPHGFRKVMGLPVWSAGELAAVLTVATRRSEVLDEEREAIELLAAQAGRAFELAHRYRERETLQHQLTHQAFHDALTGLPNRPLFNDRLEQSLVRAPRAGRGVALLYVDLDGFKTVNDTRGHHAGDQLLAEVGARLMLSTRAADTVARLGGDEFVVLIDRLTELDDAMRVAQRAIDALERPVVIGGAETTVSASIGVSWAGPERRTTPAQLLQEADRAMYLAKERGKSRIVVYDPAADHHHESRVRLEADLRQAIAENALDLHYQPLVSVRDGRVEAVEALARWRHPARGPISPAEFIPLAERCGALLPLGRLLLHKALAEGRQWQQLAQPPRIHVNVSILQLEDPSFLDTLQVALAEHEVPPGQLVLELTEATAVEDSPHVVRSLNAIKALGVQFAVDDFGRGFSSLRYLRDLPVHEVKLDRSLIVGTTTTPEDRAIVRWTAQLAHELGMRVTAEGVEDEAQRQIVADLGCDLLQGFLVLRPVPAAELAAHLGLPAAAAVTDRTDDVGSRVWEVARA